MESKLNFSQIGVLTVDDDEFATGILSQILRGFGVTKHTITPDGESAKRLIISTHFDLVICEYVLPDMPAPDFIHWIRRLTEPQVKFLPVILLTGYTQYSNVTAARDCGANIVVKKPIAPSTLFDHIAWAAEGERPYVETGSYIGPCRRFKYAGPPDGVGRRATDLSSEVGEAIEPNMSQDQIDFFIKPTKVLIS